jgi:hypothetical protein
MSKQEQKDWKEGGPLAREREDLIEHQKIKLWYAVNKPENTGPCAKTLSKLGFIETAEKIDQASALMKEAEILFLAVLEKQK